MAKKAKDKPKRLGKNVCPNCRGRGWDETPGDICIYCNGTGKNIKKL
jgi:DnaJ-class molecular chaperone